MQTASLNGFDTKITGTTGDYSKTAGSHVAVITSRDSKKTRNDKRRIDRYQCWYRERSY